MARQRKAKTPEAEPEKSGIAPTPLANAMPGNQEPGFTTDATFKCVSKYLDVHRQAALTFCASMAVAFLHAAYLATGQAHMSIAEVQKTLEKLCGERGVKRASTFAYIGAAKKLALKITQISGFKADVLSAATPDAAVVAVVNTLKGMKASKVDGDFISTFDALKRFLGMGTGRGAGKKRKARQTAAEVEANRVAAHNKAAAGGATTTVPGHPELKVPINVPINSIEVVSEKLPEHGEKFLVESLVRHKRNVAELVIAAIDAITSRDTLAQIAAYVLKRTETLEQETAPAMVPGQNTGETVQPQPAPVQ